MYPKELYRNNHYRVVFSPEEEKAMTALGWSEEMDRERSDYVVHTSGVAEENTPEKRGPGRPKAVKEVKEVKE